MAHKYNRRITVQRLVDTSPNARGEIVETIQTYLTLWASVEPARGAAFYSSDSQVNSQVYIFKVRYSVAAKAINPDGYQIVIDSDVFDIEAVADVDLAHKELHIRAVRRD